MDDYAAENILPFPETNSWHETGAYEAHERSRFLKRLLLAGGDVATDCETLEVILSGAIPLQNANALAPKLLQRFGSLGRVVYADSKLLWEVEGVDENVAKTLIHLRQTMQRVAKSQILDQPIIQSWSALMAYLRITSGYADIEQFRAMFLNHRHMLIADEILQEGTINHTPVYPREITKRALELSAAAIILIHNHPSGDATPSLADIKITEKIIEALATVDVDVHDHVIITEAGHYSFKSFGLIGSSSKAAATTAPTEPVQVQLSFSF